MKYFLIFLVLFTVSFLTVNHAYGIWLPQSPEELLDESQLIFVGTISSVNELEFERSSSYIITENGSEKEVIENYPLILDEYTVTVEEFVKNPQDTDTITVRQPTISTPGKLVPHGGFEIGDRILFYIESFDGTNTYSKESFLIPKQCETSSVIHEPRIIGSDYTMMQNGVEKKNNFTANIPIRFIAKSDTGTLSGDSPSIEYDAFISKQVGKIYKERVFHQTITADAKPCEWLSVAEWEFTADAGNYLLNGDVYKEKSRHSISNTFFSVLPETPLKQYQSGVSFDEIKCKQNLVLIQKYDKTPACVTESTKQKLIERGWIHWNSLNLTYSDNNIYCASNVSVEQCYSLEDIVFGNARKSWKVYPGSGIILPENSPLTPIYKNSTLGSPRIDLTAMLDDQIFVNTCESNGGIWNFTYHDCELSWGVCNDMGGIIIQQDISPLCTDTGITDDDPLTVKVCRGAQTIRNGCVFQYNN